MSSQPALPSTIARYKSLIDKGVVVNTPLVCYHFSCTDKPIMAALAKDDGSPHPAFHGSERIHWDPKKCAARIFLLKEHVYCPNCNAEFAEAVVAEGGGDLIIIGYESEGC